jgi:UTP--glucose-1-phosphate uridylyltransferase
MPKINKVVFPVAGLGTRFLPATKALPKEMLPIVDKPIIQYGVEEALDSGIRDIIIVNGRNKRSIEDHFDVAVELEAILKDKGDWENFKEVRSVAEMASITSVRQKEPLGLGYAVLCAESCVGEEDFAVVLVDDLIYSTVPCLKQLSAVYEETGCTVLCVERIPKEEISGYGVISYEPVKEGVFKVTGLVEKPSVQEAPSDLAVIGRYIITKEIFGILKDTQPGAKGEIQLTDGLQSLLAEQEIYACLLQGKRHDAGSKLGFLIAAIDYALRRDDLGEDLKKYLGSLAL